MQTITLPKQNRTSTVERLCKFLLALPEKAYRVEVKEQRNTRSAQQNRYLWGVVYPTIIRDGGEAMQGWTADDLHDYFLGEHFGWETLEGFGRKRLRPLRRSSKLSKTEFVDFVASIQRTMAEHGVYIPDPDE